MKTKLKIRIGFVGRKSPLVRDSTGLGQLKLFGSLIPTSSLEKKRGEITSFPWEVNRLHFHCSVNRVTLSAEGTEQLRQAKLKKTNY